MSAEVKLESICVHCGGRILGEVGNPWWRHADGAAASRCRLPTLSGLDSIEKAVPSPGNIRRRRDVG